jgi:hypothetical protein
MICGCLPDSPFASAAEWTRFEFSDKKAVARAVAARLDGSGADGLLAALGGSGGGFVFRHGWAIELLLGLLRAPPTGRMTVTGE